MTASALDRSLLERSLPQRRVDPARYIPHEPHPKQRAFLSLTCLEALYGGAAGGGKSDALLMAAAQYVHVPGYAALILRRTYPDLAKPGAIMARAKNWWLPLGVDWSERDKRFTFPSGATISFGYLDTDQDKYQYASAEFQCVVFDELTQFPELSYSFLFSRLRRVRGVDTPLRMRAGSNPGGIGHDWVKRRFIDCAGHAGAPAFVPARLEDNPSLDRESYELSLARLDPVTQQQLRDGVWVRDGGVLVYGAFLEARNCVAVAPPLEHYIIGLDFGIVDDNAVAVLGWREHDSTVFVVEAYRLKADVTGMALEVGRLQTQYAPVQIVGDTGGMGKAFVEEMGARHGIPVDDAEKTNKLGFIRLLNAALADSKVKLVEAKCADLLGEWRTLPWNENRTKEADSARVPNHASDAMLYAWRACTAYSEMPEELAPVYGTPEFYAAQEQTVMAQFERRLQERLRDEQ